MRMCGLLELKLGYLIEASDSKPMTSTGYDLVIRFIVANTAARWTGISFPRFVNRKQGELHGQKTGQLGEID